MKINKSYAICKKTDGHFIAKHIYDIISMDNNLVLVLDKNNEQCSISLDDPDFFFIFNFDKSKIEALNDFVCAL